VKAIVPLVVPPSSVSGKTATETDSGTPVLSVFLPLQVIVKVYVFLVLPVLVRVRVCSPVTFISPAFQSVTPVTFLVSQ